MRHNDRMDDLLRDAAARAIRYRREVGNRPVWPTASAVEALGRLDETLPATRQDDEAVLALLDEVASPATVATSGGRFFGFVIGSSLPATLAANWLAGAWDQNAGGVIQSPAAARLEEVATQWMLDVLGLPGGCGAGFVTCATMANFSALAAARHALLARKGWDVDSHGLFGAPPITVLVSEEVHVSVLKALGLLGLGRDRVVRVPVDDQGRMRADALPPLDDHTILCIQAGNVNTGAFDPADAIVPQARRAGAWVHVDGAFGLWAAAAPARAHLVAGYRRCRFVGDRRPQVAQRALRQRHRVRPRPAAPARGHEHVGRRISCAASGATPTTTRPSFPGAPAASRCGPRCDRSVAKDWPISSSASCRHASRFADGLRGAGYAILNDVVINQVLVSFGDPEMTRQVIAAMQADGTCWAAAPCGKGTRPCASASRRGRRPMTTWSAASRRWCGWPRTWVGLEPTRTRDSRNDGPGNRNHDALS